MISIAENKRERKRERERERGREREKKKVAHLINEIHILWIRSWDSAYCFTGRYRRLRPLDHFIVPPPQKKKEVIITIYIYIYNRGGEKEGEKKKQNGKHIA